MNRMLSFRWKFLLSNSIRAICLIVTTALSITAAHSGWREDVGVFKIGIVSTAESSIATREIAPFSNALSQEINMPVKVLIFKSYRGLIDAQANKKLHYAVHTAASYATTWAKCKCINPLAAAKLSDGSVSYQSILVVKRDVISNLDELKGKRIAISSKKSLSGYLIPKFELDNKPLHFVDLPNEPGDTVMVSAGTSAASQKLFQAGLVDGLFGWSTLSGLANTGYSAGTLVDLINRNNMSMDELQIIWKSKPIFNGPHAITKDAPEGLQTNISQFLLNLFEKNPRAYDSIENYRGGGFATVAHANYQPLIEYVGALAQSQISTKSE